MLTELQRLIRQPYTVLAALGCRLMKVRVGGLIMLYLFKKYSHLERIRRSFEAVALLAVLVLVMVLVTQGCDGGGVSDTQSETKDALYTFSGTSGSLNQINPSSEGRSQFELVISGVSPSAVQFTDRPWHAATVISAADFVRDWDTNGFYKTPPTASLTVHLPDSTVDVASFTLASSQYDASKEELAFVAIELNRVENFPTHFLMPDLFINGLRSSGKNSQTEAFSIPSGSGSINLLSARSSSSYPREFTLELYDVNPSTFVLWGAPLNGSGVMSTEQFLKNWISYGFKSDPPNASLTVRVGDETAVAVFSLKEPSYNASTGRAQFTAVEVEGADNIPDTFDFPDLFIDSAGPDVSDVSLSKTTGSWQLMVNGKEFYVKGIAGDYFGTDSDEAKQTYLSKYFFSSGANTIRVYGIPPNGQNYSVMQQVADGALNLLQGRTSVTGEPMMVVMGLTVKYSSSQDMAYNENVKLINYILDKPQAIHILAWAVGNEVFDATEIATINRLVEYLKSPTVTSKLNRPVMTVSNYLNTDPWNNSDPNKKFPKIDLWGVNDYYGCYTGGRCLTGFLDTLGLTADSSTMPIPWIVTEFGSYNGQGSNQIPSQSYAGEAYVLQLNSTGNAENYQKSWNDYIAAYKSSQSHPYGNLGGIVLDWMAPHNSGLAYHFFKCFTYNRGDNYLSPYVGAAGISNGGTNKLNQVDTMTGLWGGQVANYSPQIVANGDPQGLAVTVGGQSVMMTETSAGIVVHPGEQVSAQVTATDKEGNPMSVEWFLIGGNQGAVTLWERILETGASDGFFGNSHTSVLLEPAVTYYHADGTTKDTVPNPFVEGISQTSKTEAGGMTFHFNFTLKTPPSVNAPEANPQLNNETGAWPNQLYQLVAVVKDDKGGAATATGAFPIAP